MMHIFFFHSPPSTATDDWSLKDYMIHNSAYLIESTGAAATLLLPEEAT